MIKKIKLINFRNFEEKILEFSEGKNFIIGKNGQGKTNILESISVLGNNSLLGLHYENLTKKDTDFFYIEYENNLSEKIGLSFDKKNNKKKFLLNSKIITKPKFKENTYKSVIFSPIIMNMMYLSPSLRRDFLDKVLISSFPSYEKSLKEYKKILQSRNKVLKNIYEGKSSKDEIYFWNDNFIKIAIDIYKDRFELIEFISKEIDTSKIFFGNKVKKIDFIYKTKVNKGKIKENLDTYLINNFDRDIILKKTNIGPHIDDFDILLDNIPLINFASRGETKSVIIELKLLEISFIEEKTGKKPLLIIDDLLSELDKEHKNELLSRINNYQTFISSIDKIEGNELDDAFHHL